MRFSAKRTTWLFESRSNFLGIDQIAPSNQKEQNQGHLSPLQLGRATFDILGWLPFQEFRVDVEVIRPGRTIELVQATMVSGERAVLTCRAWYLAEFDTADVAAIEERRILGPDEATPRDLTQLWAGGYISQIDTRQNESRRPGHSLTWLRSSTVLVAGEEQFPVAEYIARVDTANGLAVRESPEAWIFPNIDLSIRFYRTPDPAWNGFDTTVSWGATGIGLTSSVLHDIHGPVGRAEQCLTVRRA